MGKNDIATYPHYKCKLLQHEQLAAITSIFRRKIIADHALQVFHHIWTDHETAPQNDESRNGRSFPGEDWECRGGLAEPSPPSIEVCLDFGAGRTDQPSEGL